uniref:Uncharacterized protein n=1 Tax=Glossina palpalis gambiensis TaxID=67801 RepID=A0A1B0BB99_9MUSC
MKTKLTKAVEIKEEEVEIEAEEDIDASECELSFEDLERSVVVLSVIGVVGITLAIRRPADSEECVLVMAARELPSMFALPKCANIEHWDKVDCGIVD